MGVYLGLVEDDEDAIGDGATGHGEYADARYTRGGDGAHLVPRE